MDYAQKPAVSIYRRHRRRRAAITLSLVSVMMLGTFAYAAAYFQGWVGASAAQPVDSAACQSVTPAGTLRSSSVTLNVYNATNRQGLAASVAEALRTLGFNVVDVANDPLDKPIAGVGEVRSGKAGAAGAKLVATRLAGVKVVRDQRADATVDVVLGNTFRALSVPPKATVVKATKPTPKPTPTKAKSAAPKPTPTKATSAASKPSPTVATKPKPTPTASC